MDYLRRLAHKIYHPTGKQEVQKVNKVVTRFEVYLDFVYGILIWDEVSSSCLVFLALNFFFWFLVVSELKLLAIVSLVLLAGFLWDCYFQGKSLEGYETKYSEVLEDLQNILLDIKLHLVNFRKESPSSFCVGMSLGFLFVSFVARSIPGYLLTYLVLLFVFFGPLLFKFLPQEYIEHLKQTLRFLRTEGLLAEDELMPFISEKDFNGRDSELESLLTDRTADSITTSMASGIVMPSHLEEDHWDDIQEDDLLPIRSSRASPGSLTDSEDSDSNRAIHFESTHFNGDSSSEEENQYVKGMQFDETDMNLPRSSEGFTGILGNVASMGSSLIGNVLRSAMTTQSTPTLRKNSSSDSDFEMVNSDEVDKEQ